MKKRLIITFLLASNIFIFAPLKSEEIVEDKTVELEKPLKIKKNKATKVNLFKLLLVFIVSFVAFVLIVDTFIVQISVYIPFAEKYLDNLYSL